MPDANWCHVGLQRCYLVRGKKQKPNKKSEGYFSNVAYLISSVLEVHVLQ